MTDSSSSWITFKQVGGAILLAGAAGYIARVVILHQTKQVLKSKTSWCNWRAETPFQELVNESPEQLAEQLLSTIQERHTNTNNPADHVFPLTHFLKERDRETELLTRYLKLCSFEQRFGINRFLKHRDLTELVVRRLDKLAYLKSLFFEWAKQHKTQKASL